MVDQAQIIDSNNASKKSAKPSNQNQSTNNTNQRYRNNARSRRNNSDYVPKEKRDAMSPDERKKVIEKRNRNRNNRSANQTQQTNIDPATTAALLTTIVTHQATQSVAPSVVTTTSGSPLQA